MEKNLKTDYQFRLAKSTDISQIWDLLQMAILRRKQDGSNQWQDGYPNMQVIKDDIQKKYGYVLSLKEEIVGYCALLISDEPEYLNIVLKIKTNLAPLNLFHFIKKIEKKLGRKISEKNSPRECDIDILDYDHKCLKLDCEGDKIIIPHPRLHKRNFVLIPLYEISKKWTHPKYKLNISKLLKQIDTIDLRSITVE